MSPDETQLNSLIVLTQMCSAYSQNKQQRHARNKQQRHIRNKRNCKWFPVAVEYVKPSLHCTEDTSVYKSTQLFLYCVVLLQVLPSLFQR